MGARESDVVAEATEPAGEKSTRRLRTGNWMARAAVGSEAMDWEAAARVMGSGEAAKKAEVAAASAGWKAETRWAHPKASEAVAQG